MRQILEKVATMERRASERHLPPEYPKIGTMLRWFPDPFAPPRLKKPARVTALEVHITD